MERKDLSERRQPMKLLATGASLAPRLARR
jgi:hypothetical protein